MFQHTQPPEGGWVVVTQERNVLFGVSTHSHPKAAGWPYMTFSAPQKRFNTQPPEGGWRHFCEFDTKGLVSTHSRPKAAGADGLFTATLSPVSTHSRPKAAGFRRALVREIGEVSTHSRPKAAGHFAVNVREKV